MILNKLQTNEIITSLKAGKLLVLPTDTIYGIHCLAQRPDLAELVYKVKKRPEQSPFITLISDIKDLEKFDLVLTPFAHEQMINLWPGPNTLIFTTTSGVTKSFRFPNNEFLLNIIKATGPLVSTSANIHSMPFAKSVDDAISYFTDEIEIYVDGGVLDNPPSSIYKIENNTIIKIR